MAHLSSGAFDVVQSSDNLPQHSNNSNSNNNPIMRATATCHTLTAANTQPPCDTCSPYFSSLFPSSSHTCRLAAHCVCLVSLRFVGNFIKNDLSQLTVQVASATPRLSPCLSFSSHAPSRLCLIDRQLHKLKCSRRGASVDWSVEASAAACPALVSATCQLPLFPSPF